MHKNNNINNNDNKNGAEEILVGKIFFSITPISRDILFVGCNFVHHLCLPLIYGGLIQNG
jgi:hypothetical protein